MPDVTATINAKSLDKTGFDEDLISDLFHGKVGRHKLAIVEIQVVDKHGPNIKGKSKVMLQITAIDPITDDNVDDHLREIQRTIRYNRGLDGHTGTTTEGAERTVEDVLAAGAKHKPHPFLPVDASLDNPICDVCGALEAAAVHSVQETLTGDEDDPTPDENELDDATRCTGASDCAAPLHTHGCYADIDGSACDDTDEHDAPWEYPGPEGTDTRDDRPVETIPDPFATPVTS